VVPPSVTTFYSHASPARLSSALALSYPNIQRRCFTAQLTVARPRNSVRSVPSPDFQFQQPRPSGNVEQPGYQIRPRSATIHPPVYISPHTAVHGLRTSAPITTINAPIVSTYVAAQYVEIAGHAKRQEQGAGDGSSGRGLQLQRAGISMGRCAEASPTRP